MKAKPSALLSSMFTANFSDRKDKIMSEKSRKTLIRVLAIILAALMVGGSATAIISMLLA